MELILPTLNSSINKWIWFAVLTVQMTISLFERISFSPILEEMAKDLCPDDINGCDKKKMGFINSFYMIMAIVSSPIGGILGDRISKKYLMIIGLCIWSGFTFLMTFMTDYWPFLIVNGLSSAGVRVFMNLSSPIRAVSYTHLTLPTICSV